MTSHFNGFFIRARLDWKLIIKSVKFKLTTKSARYELIINSARFKLIIKFARYELIINSARYELIINSARFKLIIKSARFKLIIKSARVGVSLLTSKVNLFNEYLRWAFFSIKWQVVKWAKGPRAFQHTCDHSYFNFRPCRHIAASIEWIKMTPYAFFIKSKNT